MTYVPKYQHIGIQKADNGISYHKINQILKNKNTSLYFPSAKNVIMLEKPDNIKHRESILGIEQSTIIYNRNNQIDEAYHLLIEYFIHKYSILRKTSDAYTETRRYSYTILENMGFDRKEASKAIRLFTNIYNHGVFNNISSIMESNCPVFSIENSYAGTVTLMLTSNGKWVIQDFCHSNHIEKKQNLIPKFIELSAYRKAYDEMFDIRVQQAELIISLDSGGAQVFTIDEDELNIYEYEFLDMLSKFWKQYPDSEIKFTS